MRLEQSLARLPHVPQSERWEPPVADQMTGQVSQVEYRYWMPLVTCQRKTLPHNANRPSRLAPAPPVAAARSTATADAANSTKAAS